MGCGWISRHCKHHFVRVGGHQRCGRKILVSCLIVSFLFLLFLFSLFLFLFPLFFVSCKLWFCSVVWLWCGFLKSFFSYRKGVEELKQYLKPDGFYYALIRLALPKELAHSHKTTFRDIFFCYQGSDVPIMKRGKLVEHLVEKKENFCFPLPKILIFSFTGSCSGQVRAPSCTVDC